MFYARLCLIFERGGVVCIVHYEVRVHMFCALCTYYLACTCFFFFVGHLSLSLESDIRTILFLMGLDYC